VTGDLYGDRSPFAFRLHLTILPLLALFGAPAARAFDESRPEVAAFIEEMTREHGFERPQLEQLFKDAEAKQAILDAISRPAERTIPWHEYRERFLTEKRIHEGADFWLAHRDKLARIEDDGIASAVVGILGVETSFGRITGRYRVLDALATLAFDFPPRAPFFRDELKQFLILTREEEVDPRAALGSYAGAMGAPQFISSSYRKYAVDADGDGQRNLWNSWSDVVGSVANYLEAFGWRRGEPVLAAATLEDADLSRFDVSKLELNETVGSLKDKKVRFETGLPDDAPAMLIVAQGKHGPVYRVGFNNFFVITRYNRSTMYAMAVHDLGSAIQNFMRDAGK
jgi:membrane-bound lytic murein transglycosylase B